MNILIAGCGDVGIATAAQLVAKGHAVWGLRRQVASLPPFIHPLAADLAQPLPPEVTAGLAFDAVIYAAAADSYTADAYERAYLTGVRHVIAALAPAPRRWLMVSSTSVYGQQDGEWLDETAPAIAEGFGPDALRTGEQAIWATGAGVVLRCSGIYGPGRTRLIDQVRRGVVSGQPDGLTNRIHRDDVAAALVHLVEIPTVEPLYLAVDDEPVLLREVYAWLAARLGVPFPAMTPPSASERQMRGHKRCANRRLRASGWQPRYPSFREGYEALLASDNGGQSG